MKYEVLEINKYNENHKSLLTKTIGEAKKICDFLNNDIWIRQISKKYKFHWRKLKNKSQEFHRAERAKELKNEWLTKLYNNEIENLF